MVPNDIEISLVLRLEERSAKSSAAHDQSKATRACLKTITTFRAQEKDLLHWGQRPTGKHCMFPFLNWTTSLLIPHHSITTLVLMTGTLTSLDSSMSLWRIEIHCGGLPLAGVCVYTRLWLLLLLLETLISGSYPWLRVYAENHCKSLIVNRSLFLQLYDDTTDIGRARAFGGTLLVLGTFQMATSLKTIKACSSGRRFDSGKNSKTEKSNLNGFELHRPSSKGTELLFSVIRAIINQARSTCWAGSWITQNHIRQSYPIKVLMNKIIFNDYKQNQQRVC